MTLSSASHVVSLIVAVGFLSLHATHPCDFQPCGVKKVVTPFGSSTVLLRASNGDGEDKTRIPNEDKGDRANYKQAVGRAGRRRRRMTTEHKDGKGHQNIVPLVVFFSLLLCIAPFFISDDAAPSTNYYYYQSSYSESRVYSQDGSVQMTRKESVQTNMPSLLEGRKLLEDERLEDQGYSRPSIEHDDF